MERITGRKFTGNIGDPTKKFGGFATKEERNFEKKHLRCYIRGDKFFEYGTNELGYPIKREVQQELITSQSITQAK